MFGDKLTKRRRSKLRCFSFDEIKLATGEFSDDNLLGEGQFGQLYRGYLFENDYSSDFAIKRFHKEYEIILKREINYLCSINDDNIIPLVGYCEEEDEKIFVFQFIPNGSLHDYLSKNKDQAPVLTVMELLDIGNCAAEGLDYLHYRNHIHGDVNTKKILLDGNMIGKISYFRSSSTLAGGPSASPQITSHLQDKDEFLAPECYEPNYKPHVKADVYAFGVVLLVLLCDWPKRQFIMTSLPYIMNGELHRFFNEYVMNNSSLRCLRTCESIIRDCLEYNPASRPSMNEVEDKLDLARQMEHEKIVFDQGYFSDEWSVCRRLSLEDIKAATNDFVMDNILGEGAFWKSYRGYISGEGYNGVVSVKRFDKCEHGNSIFRNEIVELGNYNHVNINTLVGYCNEENENITVYKFMSNGSLYDYLYNDQHHAPHLTVEQRLKICIGVAQGLSFLHEKHAPYHNLSIDNVLLDHDLVPRISGVGSMYTRTANGFKLIKDYKQGTEGYQAPECYEPNYRPRPEADVYAFGMLLLEVLCEKTQWKSLDMLALEFAMKRELPHLKINISRACSRACENAIRNCLDTDPDKRPSMLQVVDDLGLALMLQENYQNGKANCHQSSELNSQSLSSSCQSFSLSDIEKATNNFSDSLGEGAFGKVYRGNIFGNSYNGVVAVKRMSKEANNGILAFEKEIELVSACNHVNIISLVGFCDEPDEKILLYEFMPNGSLYDYLYKDKDRIARVSMEQRLKICIGVAKGLDYLHSRTDYVVIHSDLKTDNILLDQNLVPKISDFGLSRTRDAGPSTSNQITNHVQGTTGYLAPECYEPNYQLSRKADVYAYGVVLLEVLCQKLAWDNLVILALPSIGRGQLPNFTPDYVVRHISMRCSQACSHLIMECLDTDPAKRPGMNQVVTKLEEALRQELKYWKEHPLPFTDPKVFSSKDDRVVLYYTRSRVDVKTRKNCKEILYILNNSARHVDKRDVSLDPLFTDQLQRIFGWGTYSLPQLFIGGKHIGGVDMILKLHHSDELRVILNRLPYTSCPYFSDLFIWYDRYGGSIKNNVGNIITLRAQGVGNDVLDNVLENVESEDFVAW